MYNETQDNNIENLHLSSLNFINEEEFVDYQAPESIVQDNPVNVLKRLESILERNQDQIRFADQKAGFILTLLVAINGFIFSSLDSILPALSNSLILVLFVGFMLSSFISIVFLMLVIASRFGGKTPQTKVFFGHINSEYGHDYLQYAKDIASTNISGWIKQYAAQIIETSHIANTKHKLCGKGIRISIIALALCFGIMGGIVFEKYAEQLTSKHLAPKSERLQPMLRQGK